jgi:hypothetical protein
MSNDTNNDNSVIKDKKAALYFVLSLVAFILVAMSPGSEWTWVTLPTLCTFFIMMMGWM